MPKALARPEQSRFLLAVSAGRHAADLWLQSPQMSLCDWRDNRFAAHACGMGFTDLAERRTAFNEAFAQVIAEAVIGVVIVAVEVCHG
ncbi:hypothethical protein [Ralstonia solanacearum PSI07]|nr:hypothethical protein [Ralstonia solanacearum PSI07]